MATADENVTLAIDTAEALLSAIKAQADKWTAPSDLKAMAEAYGTVREAMPKPKGRVVGM
jgi:hypothetical protein